MSGQNSVKSPAIIRCALLGPRITVAALVIASILVPLLIGGLAPVSHNSLTVFQAKRAAMLVLLAMSLAAAAVAEARSPMMTSERRIHPADKKQVHNLLLFASIPTLLC
jgi:hypothetical protein